MKNLLASVLFAAICLLSTASFAQPFHAYKIAIYDGLGGIHFIDTGTDGQLLKYRAGLDPIWATADSLGTLTLPVSVANGGTGAAHLITQKPTGTQNGTNVTFTIAHTPVSDTTTDLQGWVNGVLQYPLSSYGTPDFTISGTTITYTVAPLVTDKLLFKYRY